MRGDPYVFGNGDALILDDVSFALGPRGSGRLSIRVGRGEIVGLLGPNGAGKTSLLRVIEGESKPLTGRIRTHQQDITHLGRRARQDAGVFVCLHDRRRLRANRSMLEIVTTAIDREPKVLLIDEPLHRLEDALSQRALTALLKTCRDAGIGVLITDHDVRAALSAVDRAYLMHEGKILVGGTPDYLLSQPND
jgi:lipopolysaccharide export system ATP-binding protein